MEEEKCGCTDEYECEYHEEERGYEKGVAAERRRISEEVGKMYDRCTDWDALKEILSIINPKK